MPRLIQDLKLQNTEMLAETDTDDDMKTVAPTHRIGGIGGIGMAFLNILSFNDQVGYGFQPVDIEHGRLSGHVKPSQSDVKIGLVAGIRGSNSNATAVTKELILFQVIITSRIGDRRGMERM
jgi:hypothetical protein